MKSSNSKYGAMESQLKSQFQNAEIKLLKRAVGKAFWNGDISRKTIWRTSRELAKDWGVSRDRAVELLKVRKRGVNKDTAAKYRELLTLVGHDSSDFRSVQKIHSGRTESLSEMKKSQKAEQEGNEDEQGSRGARKQGSKRVSVSGRVRKKLNQAVKADVGKFQVPNAIVSPVSGLKGIKNLDQLTNLFSTQTNRQGELTRSLGNIAKSQTKQLNVNRILGKKVNKYTRLHKAFAKKEQQFRKKAQIFTKISKTLAKAADGIKVAAKAVDAAAKAVEATAASVAGIPIVGPSLASALRAVAAVLKGVSRALKGVAKMLTTMSNKMKALNRKMKALGTKMKTSKIANKVKAVQSRAKRTAGLRRLDQIKRARVQVQGSIGQVKQNLNDIANRMKALGRKAPGIRAAGGAAQARNQRRAAGLAMLNMAAQAAQAARAQAQKSDAKKGAREQGSGKIDKGEAGPSVSVSGGGFSGGGSSGGGNFGGGSFQHRSNQTDFTPRNDSSSKTEFTVPAGLGSLFFNPTPTQNPGLPARNMAKATNEPKADVESKKKEDKARKKSAKGTTDAKKGKKSKKPRRLARNNARRKSVPTQRAAVSAIGAGAGATGGASRVRLKYEAKLKQLTEKVSTLKGVPGGKQQSAKPRVASAKTSPQLDKAQEALSKFYGQVAEEGVEIGSKYESDAREALRGSKYEPAQRITMSPLTLSGHVA